MQAKDLYANVTSSIVTALEKGVRPWIKPWSSVGGGLPLRSTGEHYRGANTILLWMAAELHGYLSPYWMTYRTASALGGQVRKGERGTHVIYCQPLEKTDVQDDGEEITSKFWMTRVYTVFSCDQINGLPEKYYGKQVNQLDPAQRIQAADVYFANTQADIRHGGGSAFYRPADDFIQMPDFQVFDSPETYYGTLAHESCHWTGAKHRLDRLGKGKEAYAKEELVAELGSAFLCAELGLDLQPRDDHAAYIAGWIQALKNDHKFIFMAAAQAQRACDFLNAAQPKVGA